TRIKRGALALDFMILFLEACLFVALALLIAKASAFTTTIAALFLLDSFWGFLSQIAFTDGDGHGAEKTWSAINVIATACVMILVIFGPHVLGGWTVEAQEALLLICALRSIADYALAWSFYYPDA